MLSPQTLSAYRKSIQQLVKRVERLATRCLFGDPLVHGSPAEVYRRCGRKGCKCAADPRHRHGPYQVIQVVRDGRSRQVCLRKNQGALFEQAKHYQYQLKKLSELKTVCQTLQDTIRTVIEQRTVEFPKDG